MKSIVEVRGPAPKWVRDIIAEEFTRQDLREALQSAVLYQDEPWDHTEFRRPPIGPFLWLNNAGELVRPADMATPHVYYALRMVWNHSVPAEYRTPESIHPVKYYPEVVRWTRDYRKAAVDVLAAELAKRDPNGLTPAMRDGVRWMKIATQAILNRGI